VGCAKDESEGAGTSSHYSGQNRTRIRLILARMLKNDWRDANLTKEERERIKWEN
jgi:hypothetical protein